MARLMPCGSREYPVCPRARYLIPNEKEHSFSCLDAGRAFCQPRSLFKYRRMPALDEVVGFQKRLKRLFPPGNSNREKPSKTSDSVVDAALGRILKPHFDAYKHMRDGDPEQARTFLVELLKDKLKARKDAAEEILRAKIARQMARKDIEKMADALPEHLREAFLRAIPESEKVPF